MDEPRILSNDEMAKITVFDLLRSRILMRDLEYTLQKASLKNTKISIVNKMHRNRHSLFSLLDNIYLYFFDDISPGESEYIHFLRPEDIILSGDWVQRSRSEEEIKQLAKGLKMSVKRFWEEEYDCNPDVLRAIGIERAPFTKTLKRVLGGREGKKIERYNYHFSSWEMVMF